MAEEVGDSQINFVKEAFLWQYNWIALAGAAAFALISGSGLPLMLAAGLELIYLSLIPRNRRFQRLVRSWKYAEEQRRHQMRLWQIFRELPREMQGRYADVDRTCREILANYERLSSPSQIFTRQMAERLASLKHAYLRMLHSAFQHRQHLRLTDPAAIRKEIATLERGLAAEPPKVQEINRKRIEILTKRLEKHDKIKENTTVVDAQCAAIEDVLKLIRDQSITIRDPQQLSDHLDSVVRDVEHTEQTVREMEAIFELASPEGLPIAPVENGGQALPARERLRN